MKIMLPDGAWAVMLTPFDNNKKVDIPGLEKLVEFYIDSGMDGIFACCGSSEINFLSTDEMLEISRIVVECVDRRVPVISGAIIFDTLAAQVDFAQQISATGANAVVVSTNQFNPADDDQNAFMEKMKDFVSRLRTDIYLGTYELPNPYKRLIPLDVYDWLAGSGRFLFHKDTSCDINQIKAKLEISKGTKLKLYNANVQTLLASLNIGCSGYCGTGTNYCPELYHWMCKNFKKYPHKAQKLQEYLNYFEDCVDFGENYPASAKAYLMIRDVFTQPDCRTELPMVTPAQVEQLKEVFEQTGSFAKETLQYPVYEHKS